MGKLYYHCSILFNLLNGTSNKNHYEIERYLLNETLFIKIIENSVGYISSLYQLII